MKKKNQELNLKGILISILIIEKVLNLFRIKKRFISYALINFCSSQEYDGKKIKKNKV